MVLQECELTVWNECTTLPRQTLEALDRTLQDLHENGKHTDGTDVSCR